MWEFSQLSSEARWAKTLERPDKRELAVSPIEVKVDFYAVAERERDPTVVMESESQCDFSPVNEGFDRTAIPESRGDSGRRQRD